MDDKNQQKTDNFYYIVQKAQNHPFLDDIVQQSSNNG